MTTDPAYPRHWRASHAAYALALSLALGASSSAQAEMVRITSVNGNYEANHAQVIQVHPGDVVSLSADLFFESYDNNQYGYQPRNQSVENFVWSADDRYGDECDASQGNCLANSSFEVTDYGVNFYVPYSMARNLTITVRDRNNDSQDSVLLENYSFVQTPNYVPPTTVVTEPTQYPYQTFDPDYALAGQGRWVYVDNVRYFVPYGYDSEWEPYRNGYWTLDNDGDSYVWVSYDPWGWVTDHYGVWRHHGVYGWAWQPFDGDEYYYHRHCATFFDDDDRIGWYPYYDHYRRGYGRDGDGDEDDRRRGWDDGYHEGFGRRNGRPGIVVGPPDGRRYHQGWTVVARERFNAPNCADAHLRSYDAGGMFERSMGSNRYNAFPGATNYAASRNWVNQRLSAPLMATQIRSQSGFQYANPVRSVPASYQNVRATMNSGIHFNQPVSVGSMVRPNASMPSRPVFIPPTSNNRGISMPPQMVDAQTGAYHSMPPATHTPAIPNPANHVYNPGAVPVPQNQPIAHAPVYHPGTPAPVATYAPRPNPAAPPMFHPPVNNPAPPAYHPPVNNPAPPAYHPPVNNPAPPAYHPPVNNPVPPVYHPPVNNPAPPAYHPPVNNPAPPAYHPPVNNPAPPAYHPPVNNPAPPAYHPPVNNPAPPAYHPPVNNPAPPAYHPPVNNPAPPAYHPPVNNPAPPAYHPPVNNPAPPAYHPPSAPPAYHPPAPPAYHPPSAPPAYHPPVSAPVHSAPPAFHPPVGPHHRDNAEL